jgi:hypothetical protein
LCWARARDVHESMKTTIASAQNLPTDFMLQVHASRAFLAVIAITLRAEPVLYCILPHGACKVRCCCRASLSGGGRRRRHGCAGGACRCVREAESQQPWPEGDGRARAGWSVDR